MISAEKARQVAEVCRHFGITGRTLAHVTPCPACMGRLRVISYHYEEPKPQHREGAVSIGMLCETCAGTLDYRVKVYE